MSTLRPDKNNTYCSFPRNHVAVTANGNYKLCCAAAPSPYSVDDMSPEDWFFSDYMSSARDRMQRGERIEDCSVCYLNEANGIESKRLRTRSHLQEKEWPEKPEISTIDWRASTECNAQCANCGPSDSSSWVRPALSLKEYDIAIGFPEKRKRGPVQLKDAFSQKTLQNLSEAYFAGGEPFHMSGFLENLTRLPENCFIEINTNLFHLPDKALEVLSLYKKVNIICSLDGVDAGFELMRHPIPFETYKKNLSRLQEISGISIAFNYTMSMLNVFELFPVIEFIKSSFKETGFSNFDFHLLSSPSHLHIANLSTGFRASAALFFHENLSKIENFLKDIGRWDRINDIVSSLTKYPELNKESRLRAANYIRWTIKNRPAHTSYLIRNGYIDEFELHQS